MPNITPFFQAFGPLLFGRGPRSKIAKIKRLDSLGGKGQSVHMCKKAIDSLPRRAEGQSVNLDLLP